MKKTPDSKSVDPAGTNVHVPPPDGSSDRERPPEAGSGTPPTTPTPPTDPAVPPDASRGATTEGSSTDTATPTTSGTVTDATSSDTLRSRLLNLSKYRCKL